MKVVMNHHHQLWRLPCDTPDNTSPWDSTDFEADFLDNRESTSAQRCVYRKISTRSFQNRLLRRVSLLLFWRKSARKLIYSTGGMLYGRIQLWWIGTLPYTSTTVVQFPINSIGFLERKLFLVRPSIRPRRSNLESSKPCLLYTSPSPRD